MFGTFNCRHVRWEAIDNELSRELAPVPDMWFVQEASTLNSVQGSFDVAKDNDSISALAFKLNSQFLNNVLWRRSGEYHLAICLSLGSDSIASIFV